MSEIYCHKLKKHATALSKAPYPNALGQKIQQQISAAAWQLWLDRQTMFINEYRLDLSDLQARRFLLDAMQKFLFEDEDAKPEGFKEQ
jgi:Fe-S cluster biosynthesis and repair protein YggX